jgi:hypothetical protein
MPITPNLKVDKQFSYVRLPERSINIDPRNAQTLVQPKSGKTIMPGYSMSLVLLKLA